uniref:HTH psq-type domain-containing protein n=1 Tax=Haemonchus contortus TaxID=6289 RepID=A0A7I4YX56_HAECO
MGFHVFEATVPPPPLPDNKVRRGYYTRSVLCEAVKQVMLGAMTVTQASRHFKIPRTTIQKHFSKAREQHNLKELYIRRMKAAEKGLIGRVPESDLEQRLSEHGTACLLSYGVDVWPSSSESTPATVHWRQQPVKIDLSSPDYFSQDTSSYSYENDIVVAEQCEVTSDDVKYFRSTSPVRATEEENESSNAGVRSYSSDVVDRPSTRVVLRREGSEEVVKVVVLPRLTPASQGRIS